MVSAAAFTVDTSIAEPAGVMRLRLTDRTNSKMGSAWYKRKMLAGEGFVTEFDAQFTYSLHSGADGMCFSLHNHGSGPYLNVGERGPDDKSFSILIDSYQNGGAWGDPSAACLHIKVNNTVVKTISLPDFPAITAVTNNDLSNAGDAPPYRLRLEYVPGDLDLFFNDVQVVTDLDIKLGPDNALDGNGYTWLGFGGRTGGHAENHDITRWTYESRKVTILAGGPILSEFQAAPGGALTDEDGDTSPWVEIHNAGAQPVNIGGWFLTNDNANLALWSLPSIVMEPDTFLTVFLSGKDRGDPAGHLHAGFTIGVDAGGYLALVKPDGQTIASEYTLPKSHPGTSYGTLGMEQARGYFQSPTPGSLNLPPHGLDPSLVFTLSKSYIGVGETIDIVAVSQSEPSSAGAVTYKLIAGPATLEGATLTSIGKGAIELRASIEAAGDYSSGIVNKTILVSEPAPSVPNGMPSGVVLHYDAWDKDNDGVVDVASDGANVYQWMDKSGNDRHATAPGRPPWVHVAGIKGQPSVYFRPADLSRLESPELTTADIAGPKGDAMTLFMVARYHSGTVWTQWQNGTQLYSIEFNGRFDFPNAIASQGQLTGWSTGATGTPRIIVAMKTPTEQRIYLDGLLATSRPNATSLAPGGSSSISLGGQLGTTANSTTIDFGEFLLFNRALADGEANLVGFHLQEKWGFADGLYIDPATDPQLVFQVNGQVYKDGMELPITAFSMANPPSAGIISYTLDAGPGTLADEKLTVTEPGEFTITATLPAEGDYVEQSHTVTFQIYPAEFTYDGFEGAQADFTLIGTTEITQDPDLSQPPDVWRLRITDNQNSKLGAAWYKYKMPMEDGFETEFNVHFTEAVNTGADGMTFILHNHPEGNKLNTSERGPDTDAITLQIDSYRNGGTWADPSAAFLRLTLDGQTLALANLPDFPEITTINNNDLSQSGTDAAPYKVRIVYEPGDFDVYFEDVLVMDSVDLTLNSGNALDSRGLGWFGFSGRTGGAAENHDVTYWSFKNKTRRVLLGGPVISEFMANNKDGLRDEDGGSVDWIEIHNASAGAVNLEGWNLTDDPANLALWAFPRVLLEPNQYLVVHASGKDRKSDINRLHTNFQLGNTAPGYLAFTKPDGITIVSEFKDYVQQKEDISYGTLGESQTVNYFTKPTPGNPNTGPQGIPSGKVLFSVAGGLFTDSFQVGLTAGFPEGAAIRYTLDGSVPSDSSTLYEAPIDIVSTTQIRARTFSEGWLPGPIEKDTWIQVGDDVKDFSSNLPVIVLDSLGFNVDGDGSRSRRQGYSVVIDVAQETGRSTLLGPPDYAGNMGFNVRGQTSGNFPKKSYRMEVINDIGEDKPVSLLGMPKDDDWVLHSPYSDKTLMRNYLTYTWFEQMGRYAVRRKIVEVFVNQDGDAVTMDDYRGVSILFEYIKRDGDRVDIAKLGPDELTTPDIEGGYLFKKDKGLDANTTFRTATENQELGFVYPGQPAGAQVNYLKGYLDAFEQALHGANFADPVEGYAKYIDAGSFIDVHILVEMLKQIDGYRLSSYFHKDRGGKVVSGPVWDYNLSLGNADYNGGDNPEGWYHEIVGGSNYPWYQRLFQDPEFTLAYWDRWYELRRDEFADEKLLTLIEATTTRMEESQARNFDKWQVLGTKLWPNPWGWDTRDTHRKEVDWMKDWLQKRVTWMDAQSSPPPLLNQQGGKVADGFQPTVTPTDGGQVYFTTDGSDPRMRGGAVASTAKAHPDESVILPGAVATVRTRSLNNGVWSALNEAIFIVEGAIATSSNLKLTEIHYHPAIETEAESAAGYTASDFEFLEVHNSSDQSIEIKGVTIAQGKPFDQLTLGPGLLPADAYGVLVRNLAAFQVRYPDVPSASILSEWGSGRLSNGGETILATGADGQTILEVSFQDGDSTDPLNLWPREPDGQGPSLVPSGAGADPSDPAWWKASSKIGGSPGGPDTVVVDPFENWKSTHFNAEQLTDSSISGEDADPDGDRLSNQSEYIAGTAPLDANSTFRAKQAQFTDGVFIIILATVPGKTYKVQQSQGLDTWADVSGTTFTAANNEETLRLTPTFDGRGFYRVLVE
ncbi:MAG: CotH kinase family protein [Opitutales bacterium]|nr:CotH kinase family protein [Opitutales bacterium]